MKHTPIQKHLYARFRAIVQRCYDPNFVYYDYYGGKGIKVCDEWLQDRDTFVAWGVEHGLSKGFDIDRIDNTKGYSPDNCHVVTRKQNCRNRKSNILVVVDGVEMCLTDAAILKGLKWETVQQRRLKLKWPKERWLEPTKGHKRKLTRA